MTLEGLTGGAKERDSSVGNGNGKGKKQKDEKTQIPVFKYTARFKEPLHEAILLGTEPFFLKWNPIQQTIECVHQIEEKKRILRPPDEGEYPYEPVEFESKAEIKDYTELAKHETIDSLYQKVKGTVVLYVDQDEDIIILISSDIIWTWFQDLFPTTHYYDVNGKANGIGKSTIGFMFEGTGYRVVRMTDPSAANFFRVLGMIEPGQCVIVADEADRIHKDRDALSILKEGYSKFGKVPKINTNTLKQEFFYAFCFKIRIAEEPLKGDITKGVIDRSFQIRSVKGDPPHDIKEVLDPASRIERLQKLHNDLKHIRKLLLCYRLIHFNDEIADIDAGLEGRNKELFKPLLQLFYGSKAYDEVRKTVLAFLGRKNKQKKSTAIEPILFEIVLKLIKSDGTILTINRIWETVINDIPGVYDSKKAAEYQTSDYGILYRNIMSTTIASFGAEHGKVGNTRTLTFDMKTLERTCKQYDIDVSAVRAVLPYRTEKDENITKPDGNTILDDKDILTKDNETDENNDQYGSTASTASTTDPEVAKTSEYLKNLREAVEKKK